LSDNKNNRVCVICPVDRHEDNPEILKEEALGLCTALNLEIAFFQFYTLKTIHPSTYLTKGYLEKLQTKLTDENIPLLYIDTQLKPGQQRDLEKKLKVKVIDRTGVILEIFADRAKTQEGRIQVDLAYKIYQKSRLVRAWTHLERQRGGGGFIGGPGEKQTELDRRALDTEIRKLEKDLDKIKTNRALQRRARERESFPIIALVGYTNAGKSTLFNVLTQENIMAKDMVFATLDPTMRAIRLPNGQKAILSDTVGFIRNLPTELVAAFSATLEEVNEADIILHVQDIGSDDHEGQAETVKDTLQSIGINPDSEHIINVMNKIDMLEKTDPFEASRLKNYYANDMGTAVISARKNFGIDALMTVILDLLLKDQFQAAIHVPIQDGKAIAWLHTNASVDDILYEEETAILSTTISDAALKKFIKVFGYPTESIEG
jgi:GTP-binding protein HflX